MCVFDAPRARVAPWQSMVSELKETEDALRPLRTELSGVEDKIREYKAAINAVKVRASCKKRSHAILRALNALQHPAGLHLSE